MIFIPLINLGNQGHARPQSLPPFNKTDPQAILRAIFLNQMSKYFTNTKATCNIRRSSTMARVNLGWLRVRSGWVRSKPNPRRSSGCVKSRLPVDGRFYDADRVAPIPSKRHVCDGRVLSRCRLLDEPINPVPLDFIPR